MKRGKAALSPRRARLPVALALLASVPATTQAVPGAEQAARQDYRATLLAISAAIRRHYFDPASLDAQSYRSLERRVLDLGDTAKSGEDFLRGFRSIWKNGPFSHVALLPAELPAAQTLARFDTQLAGEEAVSLAWRGRNAILTVNTMTGADLSRRINAAYDGIVAKAAARLVIDLRANSGGAFGVMPLLGHLVARRTDIGVFATRRWFARHAGAPTGRDFDRASAWQGDSIPAFQKALLAAPLMRYRITPLRPRYAGPVYVLTSKRSISAAEIAAEALQSTGRAVIVGEKTPGICLSSTIVDVPGRFHLLVPIADYYTRDGSHLEHQGVSPDVAAPADGALDVALGLPIPAKAETLR